MASTLLLLDAAATGNKKKIKRLVIDGADVNGTDANGWTALHWASNGGHKDVVTTLLEAGANVNAQSLHRETSLLLAANNGFTEVVAALLEHGADKNATDANGRTPLFVALKGFHTDVIALLSDEEPAGLGSASTQPQRFFGDVGSSNMLADTGRNMSRGDERRFRDRKRQDEQELRDASEEGYAEGVEELLAINPEIDIDSVDSQGHTALYLAASAGRTETVRILLQHHANTESADIVRHTPLWKAADGGHLRMLQLLLASGADSEVRDAEGRTPLFIAAEKGHAEVIKALVKAGASVEPHNRDDETPLFVAAEEGQVAALSAMLELGANVNVSNSDGLTPLHVAALKSRLPVAANLIDAEANVDARNSEGETPLFLAAEHGQSRIVDLLIHANARVNAHNKYGETPLYVAAVDGHSAIVSILLENGADPEVRDSNRDTPLMAAAQEGRTAVMAELMMHSANPNAANGFGETALHFAAREGFQNAVSMLIDFRANIRAQNAVSGETSLHTAAREGHVGVIQVLLDVSSQQAANVPLHLMTNINGETALHIATRFARVPVMQLLIDFDEASEATESELTTASQMTGELIDFPSRNSSVPLHIAALKQHRGAVELLLEYGAKIDAPDNTVSTPLHIAAAQQDSWIVERLLNEGADENAINARGQTPLHVAAASVWPDNVRELLAAGADVNFMDLEHKTPLDLVSANSTDPAILEIRIMMKVALNETNEAPESVVVGPQAASTVNISGSPDQPVAQLSGPTISDASSGTVFPLVVMIGPLLALVLFVIAIFFILWRKRRIRSKQEHEACRGSKASSACATNLSYRSPRNDILSSSLHPRSDFDALAMAQRESMDPSVAHHKGERGLEDDTESSSWCSTCGWSDDSDEEMEAGGMGGRGEIHVHLSRESKQNRVERRCSKGCKGRVSRKCSKVRSQEQAISRKCHGDSISVSVTSRTPFGTGGPENSMKDVVTCSPTIMENNVLYEQSSGEQDIPNTTGAPGKSQERQQSGKTSVVCRQDADDPMLEKHASDPNSVFSGWMAPSQIGDCVTPDGQCIRGEGSKVHRRRTAPC